MQTLTQQPDTGIDPLQTPAGGTANASGEEDAGEARSSWRVTPGGRITAAHVQRVVSHIFMNFSAELFALELQQRP